MKFASYKNIKNENDNTCKNRDGYALLVSRNLKFCTLLSKHGGPETMQKMLDNWDHYNDNISALYDKINSLTDIDPNLHVEHFDERLCASPLPRAYQWADGSAYVNHVELVRKARGATMPESFWTEPLMYQGGSDSFLDPYGDIEMSNDKTFGIDLEGEIAIITDDVKMGTQPEEASSKIRLIMLVNDVSLRGLIPNELAKGFGFFQSKPSSAFSPVAVTPDELDNSLRNGKIALPLMIDINDQPFGRANASVDMTFDFAKLISHACHTRPLCAGTIIGSGTVSNKLEDGPGKKINEGGVGYSCIAEIRMIETINDGKPTTDFLKFGDNVKIWMNDEKDQSIFGTINQNVKEYKR